MVGLYHNKLVIWGVDPSGQKGYLLELGCLNLAVILGVIGTLFLKEI